MIALKLPMRQLFRDVLNGRALRPSPIGERGADALERLARRLRRFLFGPDPDPARPTPHDPDDGHRPPDAGRAAPLRPSPGHHLVAARALPPSDHTHLLPRD